MPNPTIILCSSEPEETKFPPLEMGDHVSRAEFERRYDAMPHLKQAELLHGQVFLPSPSRIRRNARPRALMLAWLGFFELGTPGVKTAAHCSLRLDWNNEPQPDGVLLLDPSCGGQTQISPDDFLVGSP